MKRKLLLLMGCVILVSVGLFYPKNVVQTEGVNTSSGSLKMSSKSNYNNINSVFTEKRNSYNAYGIYPQLYEPSLQATFYGVETLYSLGKLDQTNMTAIIDFIMKHYNESSGLFMDKYAYRYLDTDFSQIYYPLTTVLEVNSYAVLALERLGALGLININEMVNFLWSCYNPISSGFIGQPYFSTLDDYFKVSTVDNTYYAIKTLDLLMSDWNSYTQQRNDLVSYINSLQNTNSIDWRYGGFINDLDVNFNSLPGFTEPYLFSSYYSIKSLDIFGMVGSININSFHLFLGNIYNSDTDFFYSSPNQNKSNIVASALGLDLSLLTGFTLDDENNLTNFVNSHRNSLGIWDGSTTVQIHELIDTFQIVRSLNDAGKMGTLPSLDVTQIVDIIIEYYGSYQGFSLISIDYPTMTLLHTLVSSFDLYERVSELDLLEIYRLILEAYVYEDIIQYNGFYSYSNIGISWTHFRSFPLEFYSSGRKINGEEIGYEMSHRATFEALDSLKKIFKLDDFGHTYDLTKLKDDILDSQFLNPSYPEQHGAFTYIYGYDTWLLDYLSKNIYFEYSYYVIKTLELLVEELNIGDITFLDFDIPALKSYIDTHIVETSEVQYFNPDYTDDGDTIIENTYYMIYILKSLDLYDLDDQKLTNLLYQNLDNENIKNIYFSYKISELLELNIAFDSELIINLVQNIFSGDVKEFSPSEGEMVDQEIFLWICEMAQESQLTINVETQTGVALGGTLNITASVSNLIISYFERNLTLMFESIQLGSHKFNTTFDNHFFLEVTVPQNPNFYPTIYGKLVVYEEDINIKEMSITFNTFYHQKDYQDEIGGTITLSVLFLTIPGGVIIFTKVKSKKKVIRI
ncbi:hypothetical protein LCGC14_0796440 [marine sediment metagenome]|uniref:Prenyltransferase alpha-alpha toroid domain-containing protein n=1 Tax=marine sediment metagenome TaxID=412755 RepID=A0A0F9QAT0_9ZZZZ|nr:hypothetical protein [bacterium]